MCFSNSLERMQVAMGDRSGSDDFVADFGIGAFTDSFQGILPTCTRMETLNSLVTDGAILSTVCFNV